LSFYKGGELGLGKAKILIGIALGLHWKLFVLAVRQAGFGGMAIRAVLSSPRSKLQVIGPSAKDFRSGSME
jgi:hypothetical protein